MSEGESKDLPPEFDFWLAENDSFISGTPSLISLLYDLNRLPEVVSARGDRAMMRQLILIVEHFKRFRDELTGASKAGDSGDGP